MTIEAGGPAGRGQKLTPPTVPVELGEPATLVDQYEPVDPTDPAEPTERSASGSREMGTQRWQRRLLLLVGTIGVIVALVFGLKAIDIFPEFHNPFAKQVTTKTQPVLLLSIQDLSRYVAAEGNFQVLVDHQENNSVLPDFLYNDRTLFVGIGTVDAYVDFSALGEGAVTVSPDGKSVEIRLPEPSLGKPSLNTKDSYVALQERGAFNRVGDMFGSDPNQQQQLLQLTEQKIAEAAAKSELRERAKKNTQLMLESLLRGLGFERVTITFTGP